MRSTSNAYKALAVWLSTILSLGGGAVPWAGAEEALDSCLLLKVASRGIPVSDVRELLAPLSGLIEDRLRIRWVSPDSGLSEAREPEGPDPFPEPDSASLAEISRRLDEANRRMEEMETTDAVRLLEEAENRSRKVRFGPVIRPYLAEIFFRQGILFLWNGEEDRCIERFARSRALRPGFTPDPALYSPSVREAWERSKDRPAGHAELLVQSMPPGGGIVFGGRPVGVTPGKIPVPAEGPVRVRVELDGYFPAERLTQWLPGDSGLLEFTLERDPPSGLPAMIAAGPEGEPAGRAMADLAQRAGATRVAVLVYDIQAGGMPVLRVISRNAGDPRPTLLGSVEWPPGGPVERIADQAAGMLAKAGWPARAAVRKQDRPWYHHWWFWTVLVTVAAGIAAAGAGGGGGSSGSSTGTIGVTF